MAFHHHVNRSAVLALLSTLVWIRFVHRSLLSGFSVLFLTFSVQILCIILWIALIYPRFSPLRHLPSAPQRPLRERLFKEPSPFHFEKWINEVPNDGLIRYYGFLNTERVLVATPEAAHQILQGNAYGFEKPHAAKLHLNRVAGKGLVWQEGNAHKRQRSVWTTALKRKNIKAFHPLFWSKANELVDTVSDQVDFERCRESPIQEKPPSGVQIEVEDYINRAVFDILGRAGNGHDFDSLSHPEAEYDQLSGYRSAFEPSASQRIRVMAALALPQWLVDNLPIENNKVMSKSMAAMRKIGSDVIAAKRSKKSEKGDAPDILQTVLEQERFSEEELLDTFLTLQAGGTHTTAAALISTIWWLAQPKYHHIQQRLRDEIHDVRPDGTNERDFERMPYLQAVLNEVLRLHSAFSWLGRQPIKQTTICGYKLPAGLSISLSPWALHRSTEAWGLDASEFNPERWLSNGSLVDHGYKWFSFGGGRRKCIGEKLALAELRCLISAVIGRLDFRFPEGTALPRTTHLVTLAFKSSLRPEVRIVDRPSW